MEWGRYVRGLIHIWSVNDAPQVNLYSSATEVPPRRPACVERSFAAAEASHWSAGPAGGSHWTADTSSALHSQSAAHNDAGEHCAVGPAPFQVLHHPGAPQPPRALPAPYPQNASLSTDVPYCTPRPTFQLLNH